jgi:hypothetical protein
VRPDAVVPLSQDALAVSAELPDDPGQRRLFEEVLGNPSRYALRGKLQHLWQFHLDVKRDGAWEGLAQDLRGAYLSITWPTWLWVVQIVKLADGHGRAPGQPAGLRSARVVGEIIIDATACEQEAVIAVRVRRCLLYLPKMRWLESDLDDARMDYPLADFVW